MSVLQSVRNGLSPIHPEGYPFIAVFFILALLLGWIWFPLFWVGLVLTAWCIFFFRNPYRIIPVGEDLVISPADGKVTAISLVIPSDKTGLPPIEMVRISVFMNVFSCHVNRIPVNGTISKVVYCPGKFANAELDKASEQNECNSLVINSNYGDIGVVQVAGLVARRIVCWVDSGDVVFSGNRFGLIRFGSRLDVYLPVCARIRVGSGQSVIAGETILASFEEAGTPINFRLD